MADCVCPHCGSFIDLTTAAGQVASVSTTTASGASVSVLDGEFRRRFADAFPSTRPKTFEATRQHVLTRGQPPLGFLTELVAWGKGAAEEIFAPNDVVDVYSWIKNALGPWTGPMHRRAVMLEVMRVLGGFESSWDWNEGRDVTNSTSVTPETIEAGLWQVSANSMVFGQDLKDLVRTTAGAVDGNTFQQFMKSNHVLAMEYIARLLRHTVDHNGPVKRHEIDPWLRRDAVDEFINLMT